MVKYSLFDQLARDAQDIEDIRVFLLYVTTIRSNLEKENLEKRDNIVNREIKGTSKRRKDNKRGGAGRGKRRKGGVRTEREKWIDRETGSTDLLFARVRRVGRAEENDVISVGSRIPELARHISYLSPPTVPPASYLASFHQSLRENIEQATRIHCSHVRIFVFVWDHVWIKWQYGSPADADI